MDYKQCACRILEKIGGKENLISAAHCATRLRLVIADDAKVNVEALEKIEGVKGVFRASGQLQIIIGTGTVNKVYEEFVKASGITAATKEEVKQAAASKTVWWKQAIKTLGDIFVPIIPAIVATGLLCGLLGGLVQVWPQMADSDLYHLLNMFSNTALTFLPILIAISAAKIFGGNIYLGAVIGMLMIHPDLVNAWSAAGGAQTETLWSWFGIWNIADTGYQGHVIPIILSVWLMSAVEKKLHKKVPEMFDLFVTPLCSILIAGFFAMTVIGPVFSQIESWVLNGAQALIALPFGIGAFIMGGVYAPTVVAGVHHMYNAIEMMMLADNGMNLWMPIATAANVAQGAAALAVALKTKDQKIKSMALPASLSAFMGITEPAIFGVNVRYGKPFVAGMIGGAFGALIASVMGVYATANGVTGIFGFLITTNCLLGYLLTFLVSAATAFVCSWMLYQEKSDVQTASERMIYAPVKGTVLPLSEVADETFASKALGDGCAIEPAEGVIKAPFDGSVSLVFDTKHAIGLKSNTGMEVLIHIGIDTVELQGEFFEVLVKEQDKVTMGQPLIKFDMEEISKRGYALTTPVLVTNISENDKVTLEKTGNVTDGEKIVILEA